MDEESLRRQVRRARGRFAAMAATYSLGVFNDNFFKQAICLIAIGVGRTSLQGYATAVFTLPWLLFSAPAGWLADRFSKRTVVIGAKALEGAAMLAGALGVLLVHWPLVFLMLFLMALQSTIFSPALNGSIPELYPRQYVLKANSVLKAVTTSAILIGLIAAGIALGREATMVRGIPWGRGIVAAGVVGIAAVGLGISFAVPKRPAADPTVRFPWTGPLDTLRELWQFRKDRLLAIAVLADMAVWFVALLQILVINKLGLTQFGLGYEKTSYLMAAELGGVAIGGLLARRLARGVRWVRALVPGFLVLGVLVAAMAAIPHLPGGWQIGGVAVLLFAAGVPGGLLLVPLESFFQIRPAPAKKGAVIAAANFAAFFAMMLAGLASNPLNAWLRATDSFAIIGGFTCLVGLALLWVLRRGRRT